MKDLTQKQVIQQQIQKTLKELATLKKPLQKSRVWQDPKGFEYLGVWQNSALLRVLIRVWTKGCLPRSEYRLKAQMDDEARSVKRNIEEGWKRPTTAEYLQFLGYSQASLEELKGDIRDTKVDGFLPSQPLSTLKSTLNIDLGVTKGPSKGQSWGEPTEPSHPYFKPLTTLNPHTLTYQIFLELINKTDYLLRSLVISLEKKLNSDRLGYQVEKARIKSRLKIR